MVYGQPHRTISFERAALARESARGADEALAALRSSVALGFGAYLTVMITALWLIDVLAPDQAAFSLAGHTLRLDHLHHHLMPAARVTLLMIPSIFAAELWLVGWAKSSLRLLSVGLTASTKTDLVFFISAHAGIMTQLTSIFSLGVALISGVWLREHLKSMLGISIFLGSPSLLIQIFGFFLVYSFFDYWTHRLDHSFLFWPLHRYHHAADEFCVINSSRVHPAAFTTVITNALPIALLGVSPEAVIDVSLFVTVLRFVIHSRIDSDFGWIGRYLIQSPQRHRQHHILDISRPVGHYSLAPFWDHLFGTWREEAFDQSLPIGVSTRYQHGLWLGSDLWRDYCDFWKGLRLAQVLQRRGQDHLEYDRRQDLQKFLSRTQREDRDQRQLAFDF